MRRGSGFVDANKTGVEVYLPLTLSLLASMKANGFDPRFPVPIDPNGDILGGAHRTACALALGQDVAVQRHEQFAWAPAWDQHWFRRFGAPEDYIDGLLSDLKELSHGANLYRSR